MLLLLIGALASNLPLDLDRADVPVEQKWAAWKKRFNADSTGFEAFKANDRLIQEHNAKLSSFTLGHNKFSDVSALML